MSPENRKRVLAAAKRLNYHLNTVAGALKSQRRNTWGLLSFWYFAPNSLDHYYAKILGGLLDTAGQNAHRVLLHNLIGRFDQNEEALRFCHDSQLSGVIIVAPRSTEAGLDELARLRVPAVLAACRPHDPALNYIDLDNVHAAQLVVDHLAQCGHRRIAFFGGEVQLSANARHRHQGYLASMKQHGFTVDRRLVHNREFTSAFSVEAFERLLELPSRARPTAIFCSTDLMAIAVMEAAQRRGLSIPGDLAVAGIDNSPESALVSPSLTTIHCPFYEMGAQAGEMLRLLRDDPHAGPQHVLLEPRLVVRGSTQKS